MRKQQRLIAAKEHPVYYRGCNGKRPYSSKAVARHHMKKQTEPGLCVYHCDFCGKWHMGHETRAA